MFLTLNLKLHFDGKDAGEVLNLGERKNSSKKGRRRSVGERLTKRKKKERPETAFFSLFILPNLHLAGLTLFGRALNSLTWTAH